jgi:hypothetical protein
VVFSLSFFEKETMKTLLIELRKKFMIESSPVSFEKQSSDQHLTREFQKVEVDKFSV